MDSIGERTAERQLGRERRHRVVIARLHAKPLIAAQLGCALIAGTLIARQARGHDWAERLFNLLLGNLVLTALIAAALAGLWHWHRVWRARAAFLTHDGTWLYRGDDAAWPLAAIRDVVVAPALLGLPTLRLVVEDDSEVTRALAPVALFTESPATLRSAILFAATSARGTPRGAVLH